MEQTTATVDSTGPELPRGGPGLSPARLRNRRAKIGDGFARYGMSILLVALVGIFAATNADFRNPDNLANVLSQSSLIGIVACGMVVVIITGGFDLSVGAVGAAASVAAASVMLDQPILLGVAVALGVGLAVGVFNGALITKISINPFVATLGTQVLIVGVVFGLTDATPVSGIPESYTEVGLGKIAGIPIPAIIFAAIAIAVWLFLKKSRFGHYIYAVGSNNEAARLAGVPTERVLLVAYTICGLLAGAAGAVLLAQTSIGQPQSATDWPLTAIAAVVVGGTPLRGGLGGVHSAVVGTLLLGVLANALNLYSVSPFWQPAVTGVVVLLAVGIDSYHRKSRGGTV